MVLVISPKLAIPSLFLCKSCLVIVFRSDQSHASFLTRYSIELCPCRSFFCTIHYSCRFIKLCYVLLYVVLSRVTYTIFTITHSQFACFPSLRLTRLVGQYLFARLSMVFWLSVGLLSIRSLWLKQAHIQELPFLDFSRRIFRSFKCSLLPFDGCCVLTHSSFTTTRLTWKSSLDGTKGFSSKQLCFGDELFGPSMGCLMVTSVFCLARFSFMLTVYLCWTA